MKNYLLPIAFISFSIISLSACKPDAPEFPEGASFDSTENYQPVKAGSTWRYKEEDGADTDTTTVSMTGKTNIVSGKTYYEATNVSRLAGKETSYYYRGNHNYIIRSQDYAQDMALEFLYLKDNVAAGTTWSSQFTDNSIGTPITGQLTGKLVERNITKIVLGKTYTNVIHTNITLTLTIAGLGNGTSTSDFYLAKNIGIIEVDNSDGTDVSTTKLIDYTIK